MKHGSYMASGASHACGCIGPQNGDPLCPCMMRSVKVVNGRYVQIIDHGPAPIPTTDHVTKAAFEFFKATK